jgi:hypothetical protein
MAVIIGNGGVGERLKPAVLKTVRPERVSGVRIPPPPPSLKTPASRRATNCSLSSITEHSFQGITTSPSTGRKCHLCVRYNVLPNVSGRSKSHQRATPLFQFQAISEPENILASNFISAVARQLNRKRSELPISKVPSRIELNPLN